MIRERRDEDLDRLCAVLRTIEPAPALLSGHDAKEWLTEHDAERSWVFDMAPVTVAPTKNVVAHVQIYRSRDDAAVRALVEHTGRPAGDLLSIGRLFVRPDTHVHGIARFLVRESVSHIQGQGKLPVLDFGSTGSLSKAFCERLGFEDIRAGEPGVVPMIYTR
jgi:GNAT superfamily N-acetyltransferase